MTGEGGIYPSRSELIRVAVREFLIRELETSNDFNQIQQMSKKKLDLDSIPPNNEMSKYTPAYHYDS